jgi:poly(A) polymerase
MHGRSRHEASLPVSHEADPEDLRDRRPPPGLALDPPDGPPATHPPEIDPDRLDADALRVVARLRHMGHRAYFVGGCVRDVLLGKTPKDFDIATDAHPGEVRAIFRNCRLIGRRFRLAHVYFRGGKVIEVATFRKNPTDLAEDAPDGGADGDLLITRDNVFGTAEEDAVRRDFTVNGLFYDVAQGEVIDYVGGRADLDAGRIATIGDPEIRMREDPVRALRAVRFASRLGFTISPDTFEAMRRHAGELARCAPARVLEEIFKILRCGGSARAFELLRASGALPLVLPALAAALDAWDEGRRRGFFAHLTALDRLVRGGEEVPEAVLLGALLMHLGKRPAGPASSEEGAAAGREPRASAFEESEALLASLVQTARLPRKIAERTRLALHAQRLFADPSRKRRRRGRGPAGQQYLADALQLFRIAVDATGEGREALERWTQREAQEDRAERAEPSAEPRTPAERGAEPAAVEVEAVAAPDGEPSAGPAAAGADGQPARRRKRRRGGRRRHRRGAGAGAPPTA